ncbi:MAG: penicillin-binding protein 2 [Actinomycetes bacterium]
MSHNTIVHRRIRALLIATFALFGVIIAQLFSVQVVRAGTISERAENELLLTSTLLAPRGVISDVNGIELARSVAAITIVVDQTQITDAELTAKIASPALELDEAELVSLFTGNLKYKIIVKNAKPAMWSKLQASISDFNTQVLKEKNGLSKRIVGFIPERGYVREYPTGTLASSLIGFINYEGVGAAGIESSLNSELSGINGEYIYENGAGTIIPGSAKIKVEAKAGTSVRLTVDRDIQWVAQDAISKAVASSKAKSGTVIVMDPKTGAIIAQASAPTFNPSKPIVGNLNVIRNPAVQDVYEPGSTGKVITYAAALEEKKLTANSVYTVPYSMKVSGTKFSDHETHPTQRLTATGALAISSNTASIKIGQQLGSKTLYQYLTDFGFGKSTGSHLPGESAGLLRPVSDWSGTSLPTFAYGQGYSVTALQATSVFATIANDGVRVTPTVVAGTTDASGNYIPAKDQQTKRVVSAETAKEIRKMLESVVSANGTAPTAAIPGYRVAGKTGTAMRVNSNCSCYSGYTASFIGFAPADKPAYVVSVTIQDPKGMHWGGALGGPVFAEVMKFVLQSKHIPPSVTKLKAYPLTEEDLKKSASAI